MTDIPTLFSPDKYHEIGPFRFPIYEDLTPKESKALNALVKKQSQSTVAAVQLARRVAQEKGKTVKQVMDAFQSLRDPEHEELLYDYFDEVQALNADESQREDICTLVFQMRGELKNPETGEYSRLSDWTSENTDEVPSKLLTEVFQYIMYERDGWPTPGKPEDKSPTPKPTKTST